MVLVDEDEREKAVAAGGRTVCLNVPQEGIAKAVAQIESKMVAIAKFLCPVSWTKRLRSLDYTAVYAFSWLIHFYRN